MSLDSDTQTTSRLNGIIDGDSDAGGDGEESSTGQSRGGSSGGKIAGQATVKGAGKAVKTGGKLLVTVVGWKAILVSVLVGIVILVLLLILGLAIGVTEDGENGDCTPDGGPVDVGDISPNEEAHAKAIHKVFSAKGMSNQNIAGILGNWSQESANDPTRLQGVNSDPYKMTEAKKKQAEGFTKGIGLAQWTGDRNTKLREYAEEKNKNWWSPSLQLNYMTDPKGDNPADVAIVKDMIKTPLDSPKAATEHFHDKWERSGAPNMANRIEQAEKWYEKMKSWTSEADPQSVKAAGSQKDIGEAIAGGNVTRTDVSGIPQVAGTGGGNSGSDDECEDDDSGGGGEAPKGSGKFIHPAPGAPLTSPFGYRVHPITGEKKLHSGQDYGVACGTTLFAVDAGKVSFAGWQSGYGNRVEIDHGDGIITTYSHNTSLIVEKGDSVKQKDKIAKSGTTGASTGCHLHFEVKQNGKYVDPLEYLPK